MAEQRVELITRESSLEPGLRACVADPLWMLARQWQVGELHGEDAASPVKVSAQLGWSPLDGVRSGSTTLSAPAGSSLEAIAEALPVRTGPHSPRLAAEQGLLLLRLLRQRALSTLAEAVRACFPLTLPPDDGRDPGGRAVLERLALKAPDARLALAVQAGTSTGVSARALDSARAAWSTLLAKEAARATTLSATLNDWAAGVTRHLQEPKEGSAWSPADLHYQVSLEASASKATLSAPAWPGGSLSWSSVDLSLPAASKPQYGRSAEALPAPVHFVGMPNDRWWAFEDERLNLASLAPQPGEMARLILAEFALVYSNDWFLMPLRAPSGSLCRVSRVTVTDNFGGSRTLTPLAVQDHAAGSRPWRFCELSGDPSAAEGESPWVLLLPAIPSLSGPAVEQVAFVRDEQANLAWAVEHKALASSGRALHRSNARPQAPPRDDSWAYALGGQAPPGWIPLLPQREADEQIRLHRARLPGWDPQLDGAWTQILTPDRPFVLREETLPASGVQVERTWQLTRGEDGRLILWLGAQRKAGRVPSNSGLGWDQLRRGRG